MSRCLTTSGVCTFGYTYDANKNKLTETLGSPMANYGFDSTTYDNEDRLTAWSRVDDNKDQEWELSAAGDWDSFTEEANEVERTHNDVHELTAVGQTSLTYDAKGNLTKDGAQTYAKYIWDFDNRLQAVDTDDDDTSEVFYTYDALGRRLTKSIVILSGYDQGSSSSGISRRSAGGRSISRRGASTTVTTTTVFVPDGQQEVAEYTYVSTVGTPNLTKKYVYASYIDEPVLMLNVSGETETKYYYHQNSLYSVAALTDQSGTVVERYSYLAYGNITFHDADGSVAATQSSTVANPYLFTGRRLDPETGLQYSRARYYHFDLGRWISRDPIGYEAKEFNLYRYCDDSPLIHTDPEGTSFWDWVPIVGTIINCSSTPMGSATTDYASCKPKCNDDAGKQSCRNCVQRKSTANLTSYLVGAVPGTAVDIIGAGFLVGGKAVLRNVLGSILIVDAVWNAACTVNKAMGIRNAAKQAEIDYCS